MQSPVLERLVGGAVLVGLLLLLALAIGPRDGLRMPDKGDLKVSVAEDAPEPAANGVASFPAEPGKDTEQVSAPASGPAGGGRNPELEATASAVQAQRNSGISGDSAVDSQPESEAPDSAVTSAPAGRWAVQVGNFTVRANADRLSEWCLAQGYGVRVLPHTRGNQTEYRVRVGPYASRADAASARAELALRNRNGFIAGWEDRSP